MVYVEIQADRFLYGQCRMLVGALVSVGCKRVSVPEFHELCAPGGAIAGRAAAPAMGLCLLAVGLNPDPFNSVPLTSGIRHPFATL